jgi:hypothetical protein
MCAPEELKQKASPDDFEAFNIDDIEIHIQRDLLDGGRIGFTVPGSGEHEISLE